MSLVSIIVPVYNTEKYLDKCVESLVLQTLRDIEIILVDDGSPDNCPKKCDDWAKKDSRVKVIHQENSGVSAAINRGIRDATSKYIGFVDSDDWIEKQMFQDLYEEIIKNDADLVQCGINGISDNDFSPWNIQEFVINKDEIYANVLFYFFHNEAMKSGLYPSRCNKIYLKDKLLKILNLCLENLQSGEDYLLNTAYLCISEKVVSINKCYYNYRRNDNSLTTVYTENYKKSISDFFNSLVNIANYFQFSIDDLSENMDFSYCNAFIFAVTSSLSYNKKISEFKILRSKIKNSNSILKFSKNLNIKQTILLLFFYLKIYLPPMVAGQIFNKFATKHE